MTNHPSKRRVVVRDYFTAREVAWRNLMVAAINAGLEQRVFKLRQSRDAWAEDEVRTYEFALPGLPHRRAVVHARDIGHDEIMFHVMVEPDATGLTVIDCRPHKLQLRHCSGAAVGWFERRRGKWLQRAPNITAKTWLVDTLFVMRVEPLGYRDGGRVMM